MKSQSRRPVCRVTICFPDLNVKHEAHRCTVFGPRWKHGRWDRWRCRQCRTHVGGPAYDFNWESTRALNNADYFIHEPTATSGPLQKIAVLNEKEELPSDGDGAEEQSQRQSIVQP